jgi:hypothetical protein
MLSDGTEVVGHNTQSLHYCLGEAELGICAVVVPFGAFELTRGMKCCAWISSVVIVALSAVGLKAQDVANPGAASLVPRLVKFAGVVRDADGKPLIRRRHGFRWLLGAGRGRSQELIVCFCHLRCCGRK